MSKKEEQLFSMFEFKEWMSKQENETYFERSKKEDTPHEYIGEQAFAKVSKRKLMDRVISDEDEAMLECIIDEFIDEGGFVADVDGRMLVIEVGNNSSITLPRFCIKVRKTK